MQTATSHFLRDLIEGTLSKESVIQALQHELGNETKNFLLRWIDESSISQVEKFVFATTGSKTLLFTTQIAIQCLQKSERPPSYQTCSLTVEIPKYGNYPVFKAKLEQSLSCIEGSGFQMC